MTQRLELERPWLQKNYSNKQERTLNLVIKGVDFLKQNQKVVSLANLEHATKVIDPMGRGVHRNTIRTNVIAYDYYKNHSSSYQKRSQITNKRGSSHLNVDSNVNFEHIKPERNLENVKKRYRKMTKQELINKLIQAEQHIAEKHKEWLINQFEKLK
ncbi:hypothetical protein [Brevibacillus sp. MS2.2]|uniref:hypothetical protein n=1 Tax=Brevibacillus sp. MS2.2 TaxID=2738981 RepID=UPI00156BB285|nr:hypothetical protein [Brevibacillus sp. MS2.2]NRR22796.1 hypothetical protein [Brevibacillus sp. MS2.2]